MRLKNQMGKFLIGVVSVSVISLTGCAATDINTMVSQGNAVSATGNKLNPTNQNRVKIYYANAGLPKHYKVVGRVSAENYNMVGMEHSQASIAEELKKQAANIGANGVINVSTGLTQTTGDAIIAR
jgi:hypothetical protein